MHTHIHTKTTDLDKIQQVKLLSAAKQNQIGKGSRLHRKHKSDTLRPIQGSGGKKFQHQTHH